MKARIAVSRLSNGPFLVYVSSCSNTGLIRNYLYWTSRKNSSLTKYD
jgi:hypothetical protein